LAVLFITLRVLLLGYERIAGKQIAKNENSLIASWAFFTSSLLFLFPFYSYVNLTSITASLFSGTIYSFSFFLYTYALSKEDASVIAPLYNINIFFLLLITFIFLGESLTLFKIIGASLMFYGISYLKKGENLLASYNNILKNKGSLAMIFSSVLLALGRTFDGYFANKISPLSYGVSIYIIVSFYLLISSLIKTRSFKMHWDIVKRKKFYLIGGGIANSYSYIALLFAFKFMDVNVAVPLSMLSSIVTAILAYIVFKEKINLRLVGILFLITGSFLIYLG
jgi:transporter family protein